MHPLTLVIGEQAVVDIMDLSKVFLLDLLVMFLHQQWAGAEDGEGSIAGTWNDREEKKHWLSARI